jgi:hypothetical protein
MTEDIKVLRSSGRPTLAVGKSGNNAGETAVYVDEFRITPDEVTSLLAHH